MNPMKSFVPASLFSYSTIYSSMVMATSLLMTNNLNADTLLDTIHVEAKRDSAVKPFSVIANPSGWTVQSVDVVNHNDVELIGADRIEDYADSIPGVLIGRNEAGIASNVFIRGFSLGGRLHLNGLRDSQRFYLRDPATIERVEVVKGMDSVALGSGSPGGTVNFVTKKPQYKSIRTLNIGIGSPERYNVSADVGGAIHQSGWAWRSILSVRKAETGRKNVGDDRLTFMPALLWTGNDSELLVEGEYNRQNRDFDFDNVFADGEPVYDVSYTDPRTDSIRTSKRLSAQYSHNLSTSWLVRLNASYLKGFRDEKLVGFAYMNADERTLEGFYRKIKDNHKQYSLRTELEHNIKLSKLRSFGHKTTLGLEFHREDSSVISAFQVGGFTLDVFNPVFDYDLPTDDLLTNRNIDLTDKEQAAYLQHQVKSEKVLLTAGLRYSHFSADSFPEGAEPRSISNSNLNTSLGGVWQFKPPWKAFANRTESFSPNSGRDRTNNPFDAKQGLQYELGLRYQKSLKNSQALSLEGSIYQIDQDNLLERDPVDPTFKIPVGKVRVNGFEFKSNIPLGLKTHMLTSYSYYDSEIIKADNNQGNQLHSIPKHTLSLKLNYKIKPNVKTTLSATHVGTRMGDNNNSFKLPSYTRLDAGIRWKLNPHTSFNLGVRNVTDANYVATGGFNDFLVLGRDRTITVKMSYDF